MRSIIIHLPEPLQTPIISPYISLQQTPLPEAEGILWFAEETDYVTWLNAINAGISDQIVLQSAGYHLKLVVFTGFHALSDLPRYQLQMIYLPANGVKDREIYNQLQRSRNAQRYFMRFFEYEELGYLPNEEPAVQILWDEVQSEFHTAPFLAGPTTDDIRQFHQWLAKIVVFTNMTLQQPFLQTALNETERLGTGVLELIKLLSISDKQSLFKVLAFRREAPLLLDKLQSLTPHCKGIESTINTLAKALSDDAQTRSNATNKLIYQKPLVVTLGTELMPRLRVLLRRFDHLAAKLCVTNVRDLQDLGEELKRRISQQTQILALIGAFSSGKTTLLNALLIGNDTESSKKRAFHTQKTANTAIVAEIRAAGANEKEYVQFYFRQHVRHPLGTLQIGEIPEISHAENIEELIRFLRNGVLFHAQIEVIAPRLHRPQEVETVLVMNTPDEIIFCINQLTFHKGDGLPVGIYYFSAQVNQQRLQQVVLGHELFASIDLSTDDGWDLFQGKKAVVEGPVASLLIERADIHLHHPLLALTTIADTPGTGSYNDRHDIVTDMYLNKAAGFILLLPTQRTYSRGVQEILDRVKHELATRYKGDFTLGMESIAFVINCHTSQNIHIIKKNINKFLSMIKDTFELTETQWQERQRDPERTNFFVVQLTYVQEGEHLETLFGYPSLNPLKRWIEKLFRTGRYRERYAQIYTILGDQWTERQRRIQKQLYGIRQKIQNKSSLVAQAKRFCTRHLKEITERYLADIQDFREGFHYGSHSIRNRMLLHITDFQENAIHLTRNDLEQWQRTFTTLYEEFNQQLENLREGPLAEDWIEEVKAGLRKLDLPTPALVGPNFDYVRFNTHGISTQFEDARNRWPTGTIDRVVEWFRRTFTGNDTRQAIVDDIANSFLIHNYDTVWFNHIAPYIQFSEDCIKDGRTQVEKRCRQWEEEEMIDMDVSQSEQLLQNTLNIFNSFDRERKNLLTDLDDELTRSINYR